MVSKTLIRKEERISGRVISPSNLRQLADIIVDQYRKDSSSEEFAKFAKGMHEKEVADLSESSKKWLRESFDDRVRKKFVLREEDKTTYESDDEQILRDGGSLDTKRIVSVTMNYENRIDGKSISVEVNQSSGLSPSEAEVKAFDETWVSGTMDRIRSVVSGCKRQYAFPLGHRIGLMVAIVAIGSWLGHNLVYIAAHAIFSDVKWNSSADGNAYFVPAIIGVFVSLFIVDKVSGLFPSVEVSTGPPYSRSVERRRKAWWLVLILLIVPLVLSIITNLLIKM